MSDRVSIHPKEIIKDSTVQLLLLDHEEISTRTEFHWPAFMFICVCVSSAVPLWLLTSRKKVVEGHVWTLLPLDYFTTDFGKHSWVLSTPTNPTSKFLEHLHLFLTPVPLFLRLLRHCLGVCWHPAFIWTPHFGGWDSLIVRTWDALTRVYV